MATFRDLLSQTKAEIREITPADADVRRDTEPDTVFLDVREPDEFEQGAIPGSVYIPRGHLEAQVESRIPQRDTPVVVFCAGGVRSAFAAKTLGELGYTDVVSMSGGFNQWKDQGREWKAPRTLDAAQRNRYQRHLLLPEVGDEGQLKLLDAKVLLLGAGGLGSPAALYLAAAGVGTIGIIDMDVVDESNLQRQIIHNIDRVGMRKVDSAKETLNKLNPEVNVITPRHPPRRRQRHGAAVAVRPRGRRRRQLPQPLPPQRRLAEDRHAGRARLDLPLRGPGHRVQAPRRALLPVLSARAAPAGAGPLVRRGRLCSACCPASSAPSRRSRPSSRSSTSATPCRGRLLAYDSLEQSFMTYKIRRDPNCPACSIDPADLVIAEYDQFCMPHPVPAHA